MRFWCGVAVGVAGTIVLAFVGGYIARERDPRHNKWGFDDRIG